MELEPEYAIMELHEGEDVCVHFIRMPEDTKRHPLKSLNGFRRRMTKRAAEEIRRNQKAGRSPHPAKQFRIQFIEDFSRERKMFRKVLPDLYPLLPEHIHENIFDFYNHISYDHKRNRFVPLGVPNGEGQEG